MDFIEVVVTVVPEFFEWLFDQASVFVTATPEGFGIPLMVVAGFFLIILMGREVID